MTLQHHEIAEAGHRILNPFTEEKLLLLGEVCRLRPGQRQLDLACGKGEMLCRWAERHRTSGLGVDLSQVFLTAATARAEQLGVSDRVRFRHGDAGAVTTGVADAPGTADGQPGQPIVVEAGGYDVVSCIGATWIGAGLAGTIELLRPALRPGGLVLIGEPYWIDEPPPAAYQDLGVGTADYTSLAGTLDRFEAAGTDLVEMVLADQDSWDRYVASQWWTIDRWLHANPDHPEAGAMAQFLHDSRGSHLRHQRRFFGWGVFVLRDTRTGPAAGTTDAGTAHV